MSEERLLDSKSDSGSELDNCALLGVVVDDNNDEGDEIIQNFIWEDMNSYKIQSKSLTGSVGLLGAAEQVTEIVDINEFFNTKLIVKIIEEVT